MDLVAAIATRLAVSGAETYRVEESVNRILTAYGVESRVYSVPNSLFITISIPNQLPFTQLCRMPKRGNDIDAVECYNSLSRRICSEVPDLDVAMEWIKETESQRKHYSVPMNLLGHMLVASGFCLFFGGSGMDVAARNPRLRRSDTGQLHSWDFEVPFSQYADLRGEGIPEAAYAPEQSTCR